MVKYTLDSVIRELMIEQGETTENKYARYLQLGISGLREFNFDLANNSNGTPATAHLTINDNLTADLPNNYINYSKIGVIDSFGNLYSLGFNNNIRRNGPVTTCGTPTLPAGFLGAQSTGGFVNGVMVNWDGYADNVRNGEITGRFFGVGGGTNGFGYYRINMATAQIELTSVRATYIFLEYLADLEYVNGEFLVHPFVVEALKCYICWKLNQRNDKRSGMLKQESRMEYFNEFQRAKARFNSLTVDQWQDEFRRYNMLATKF